MRIGIDKTIVENGFIDDLRKIVECTEAQPWQPYERCIRDDSPDIRVVHYDSSYSAKGDVGARSEAILQRSFSIPTGERPFLRFADGGNFGADRDNRIMGRRMRTWQVVGNLYLDFVVIEQCPMECAILLREWATNLDSIVTKHLLGKVVFPA